MKNIEYIAFQPDDKFMDAMEEALFETMKTGTGIIQTKWMGVDFAKPGSEKTVIFKSMAVGKTEFFDEWIEYCATFVPWDTRKFIKETWPAREGRERCFINVFLPDLKLSVLAVRWAWSLER